MKFAYLALAACAMAVLGSCTTKPKPQAPPEPVRTAPVQPRVQAEPPAPAAADWRDLPLTPGAWVYSLEAGGSQALFGPADSEAAFVVRCDSGSRRVVLQREGVTGQIRVRTTAGTRSLPASARTEPLAYSSASLAASDALLDEMVFSRGQFTVEAEGLPMLVLPAWPEPARVVEDCRG